jgi:3-oxoacyl-[acyl-carrier protein] reductase
VSLSGRVAVVTGASEGIGRGIAVALGAAGADVMVVGRRRPPLAEVRDEITALGSRSLAVTVDVTDVGTILSARDACMEAFGRVDILVNDAAFSVNAPAFEITEAEWHRPERHVLLLPSLRHRDA